MQESQDTPSWRDMVCSQLQPTLHQQEKIFQKLLAMPIDSNWRNFHLIEIFIAQTFSHM